MFAAAPSAPAAPTLGVLIDGGPCLTTWVAAGDNRMVLDVPNAPPLTELAVFLLPGVTLPPGRGVVIYARVAPYDSWAALGALGAARPSVFIRPIWPAEWARAPFVRLGASLEPTEAVASAAEALAAAEGSRAGFAELVARDLSAYLGSYATTTAGGERLVLPRDAVDKWFGRFVTKWKSEGAAFLYRPRSA